MNRAQKIAAAVSLAVLVVCLLASFMTRGIMENLPFLHGQKAGWNAVPRPYGIVDQRPWQTAKTLAALAVSAEELQLAREAERLADHEVDQNFAQSLRQASAETRQLTGDALPLQKRVTDLQQTVKEDQDRVAALTAKAGPAAGAAGAVSPATDDLDVAKAQLSLDQDELSDSMEDLARASGDHRGEYSAGVIRTPSGDEEVQRCRQGERDRPQWFPPASTPRWRGRSRSGGRSGAGNN